MCQCVHGWTGNRCQEGILYVMGAIVYFSVCLPYQLFAYQGVRMGESVLPQTSAHVPVEGGLGIIVKKVA